MIHSHHSIDSFGIKKVSLSNIRIEKIEDRVIPAVPFPHRHDFFQVMLVTQGSGWHQIDFKKYAVKKGQIFTMKPGQMHSWGLKKNVKGFLVEFNNQSLNSFKEGSLLIKDFAHLPDECELKSRQTFASMLELCKLMNAEFEAGQSMHDLCLQSYLSAFIITFTRTHQLKPFPQNSLSIIEKFKELVEEHFRTSHKVDFYAKKLGLSAKVLTMQLSRTIRRSPRDLIQERILLEAKRYLAFSDLNIAEIGYELGFDDANYFSRFFRIHEHQNPAEFRKKMRD